MHEMHGAVIGHQVDLSTLLLSDTPYDSITTNQAVNPETTFLPRDAMLARY